MTVFWVLMGLFVFVTALTAAMDPELPEILAERRMSCSQSFQCGAMVIVVLFSGRSERFSQTPPGTMTQS